MDEIEAWGTPDSPRLHWFGLTAGYYFLEVGDQKIFWYSEAACRQQGWAFPPTPAGFELAVSYQVCRLFEDIGAILPSVMEPVPEDIASLVDTAESQRDWQEFVERWDWEDDTEAGLLWLSHRTLDTGYLRAGPSPVCWRVGDTIKLRCDDRSTLLDGVKIWSNKVVEFTQPVDAFVADVQRFGDALLMQMD